MDWLLGFFFHINPINFKVFATLLWIIDAILSTLIIWEVPYTEIDWSTYMQQVSCYERGIRNYSEIEGDTGPVVYPAGHIWSHLVLSHVTDGGKNIRFAQYIFEAIYLASLLLVFRIYYMSHRLPPFVLIILCCMSYRIHSIYLLRLFNDPIAMLLFYLAVNLWISGRFTVGSVFYSLAVSVKMNILLFAPAFFFILLLRSGYWNTFKIIMICGIVQIILALPFLVHDPISYLQRSFNLKRVFLYKWTVNWRFLPEHIFLDFRLHLSLLAIHIILLAVAGFLWFRSKIQQLPHSSTVTQEQSSTDVLIGFRSYGSYSNVMKKVNLGLRVQLSVNEVLLALFTANMIGISVARSLHYQFYSWYFHTLPYLIFSGLSFRNDWLIVDEKFSRDCAVLFGIELCWNTYPSTALSSAMLHSLHATVFFILIYDYYVSGGVRKLKAT